MNEQPFYTAGEEMGTERIKEIDAQKFSSA